MSDENSYATRYEWERIMRRCRMKPLTKYVGMTLAQYANNDGTSAFPAVAKLARVTCLSERSVRSALTELRELGLIVRVQKGGMRGTQAYPDVHCLKIPADLLERFDLLTPGEEDPNPPTPNRQDVPPGDDPNRHVVPPNRHVDVAQPANDDTPTGTTCLLPISTYLPATNSEDQRGSSVEDVTTRDDAELLAYLQSVDELAARRAAR